MENKRLLDISKLLDESLSEIREVQTKHEEDTSEAFALAVTLAKKILSGIQENSKKLTTEIKSIADQRAKQLSNDLIKTLGRLENEGNTLIEARELLDSIISKLEEIKQIKETEELSLPSNNNLAGGLLSSLTPILSDIDRAKLEDLKLNGVDVDRKGRPVLITNQELLYLCILSTFLDGTSEEMKEIDQELKREIRSINGTISKVISLGCIYDTFLAPRCRISRSKRLQAIQSLEQKLRNLSQRDQALILSKEIRIRSPYFLVGAKVDYPDDIRIEIIYKPGLLYGISSNYACFPMEMLKDWSKRTGKGEGMNTELWTVIFPTILKIIPTRLNQYKKAIKDDSDSKLIKEILTYEENYETTKQRIPNIDYSSKKQYRAKFKTDLEKCLSTLKYYQIIKGYKEVMPGKNGYKWSVTLNESGTKKIRG